MNKQEMLALLRRNVLPALGCTEPVCVALAAADAAKAVGGTVASIELQTSRNIYKNGVSVAIAGFDKVGLHYAAALGAYIADTSAKLEIMSGLTPEITVQAAALAESGKVIVSVDEAKGGVYVRCTVHTDKGTGVSVIQGAHTNIIRTEANGEVLHESAVQTAAAAGPDPIAELVGMKVSDLRALATSASEAELEFLNDGIEMNGFLADYGVREKPGIGIVDVIDRSMHSNLMGSGLLERCVLRVGAATEVRLAGCRYATMSSAGSGSKGIAVIVPIVETAKYVGASREQLLQALAFGHLLNEKINAQVGKLSAVCACAMAASIAASAAVTWLLGGDDERIAFAIRNMTGSITGMVCDGGKMGCVLKLTTATSAAMLSAFLAANNVGIRATDGVCGETADDCIRNMGRVSSPGMTAADQEILHIMLDKKL